MRIAMLSSITDDPHVLAAIAEFRRAGHDRRTIMARLRISQATYYRCLESLARRAESDPSPIQDDE